MDEATQELRIRREVIQKKFGFFLRSLEWMKNFRESSSLEQVRRGLRREGKAHKKIGNTRKKLKHKEENGIKELAQTEKLCRCFVPDKFGEGLAKVSYCKNDQKHNQIHETYMLTREASVNSSEETTLIIAVGRKFVTFNTRPIKISVFLLP